MQAAPPGGKISNKYQWYHFTDVILQMMLEVAVDMEVDKMPNMVGTWSGHWMLDTAFWRSKNIQRSQNNEKVKWSDGPWHVACGDVLIVIFFSISISVKQMGANRGTITEPRPNIFMVFTFLNLDRYVFHNLFWQIYFAILTITLCNFWTNNLYE